MESNSFILYPKVKDERVLYVGIGKFKTTNGEWKDAILYKDNHGEFRMREAKDFIEIASSERSTINNEKAYSVTAADIVEDLLGPGCTPDCRRMAPTKEK